MRDRALLFFQDGRLYGYSLRVYGGSRNARLRRNVAEKDVAAPPDDEIQRSFVYRAEGRRGGVYGRGREADQREYRLLPRERENYRRLHGGMRNPLHGRKEFSVYLAEMPNGKKSWEFFDDMLENVQGRRDPRQRFRGKRRRLFPSDGVRQSRDDERSLRAHRQMAEKIKDRKKGSGRPSGVRFFCFRFGGDDNERTDCRFSYVSAVIRFSRDVLFIPLP